MLEFSQMVIRLITAMVLGALIGVERELIGKEAGIRTTMLVSAGAAIFAMISIIIPYVNGVPAGSAFSTIPDRVAANIVVGIGFLGAGIIIKTGEHVRGLTTAAVIWATAAVGSLVGLGLIPFAATSAIILSGTLYLLRKFRIYEKFRPHSKISGESEGN